MTGAVTIWERGRLDARVGPRQVLFGRMYEDSNIELDVFGNVEEDALRRDFTINAMAIGLNQPAFGSLLDPFDGLADLSRRLIRTPLDPEITFEDDPPLAVTWTDRVGFFVGVASTDQWDTFSPTFNAITESIILTDLPVLIGP